MCTEDTYHRLLLTVLLFVSQPSFLPSFLPVSTLPLLGSLFRPLLVFSMDARRICRLVRSRGRSRLLLRLSVPLEEIYRLEIEKGSAGLRGQIS